MFDDHISLLGAFLGPELGMLVHPPELWNVDPEASTQQKIGEVRFL